MQVLIAVLDDLFQFALRSLFGSVAVTGKQRLVGNLAKPLQPLLPLLPPNKNTPPSEQLVSAHGSYFVSEHNTAVHLDPVAAYDNVIDHLSYGSHVSVLKYGGRWAMVRYRDVTGWVLKDAISSSANDVFPQFASGSVYDATHVTTKKVRELIDDMFATSEPALPLTGAEYVTYRLLRNHRQIQWPQKRPRLPGQWQSILRGQPGIHIGVVPKTGAVMECVHEEQGYLLYVEAVFPDESMQVSAVDYDGEGVYTESVITKEVWRELRPVFIEVS